MFDVSDGCIFYFTVESRCFMCSWRKYYLPSIFGFFFFKGVFKNYCLEIVRIGLGHVIFFEGGI